MFKLVIQDDEGKTTVVPLIRDEITIGRKEGNTIRLTERNVSRKHARIMRSNGAVAIEDLGSYNGVRVNGSKISQRTSLSVSDRVQIGDYLIELKAEGAEVGAAPVSYEDAKTRPVERIDPAARPAPPPTPAMVGNPNATMVAMSAPVVPPPPAAAPQAGHGRLVLLSSSFAGQTYDLDRPELVIGRGAENDISIDHRSISRNHAKIVRDASSGRYTIADLKSANGVRINGEDYGRSELRKGDVVDLGHVRMRFVEAGEDFVFGRDAQAVEMPAGGGGGSKKLVVGLAALAVVGGGIAVMASGGGGGAATPAPSAGVAQGGGSGGGSGSAPAVAAGSAAPAAGSADGPGSAAAAAPVDDPRLGALRSALAEAVKAEKWAAITKTCSEILAIVPADAECAEQGPAAAREAAAQPTFEAFTKAVGKKDLANVRRLFDELDAASLYRERAQADHDRLRDEHVAALKANAAKLAAAGKCKDLPGVAAKALWPEAASAVEEEGAACTAAVAAVTPSKPVDKPVVAKVEPKPDKPDKRDDGGSKPVVKKDDTKTDGGGGGSGKSVQELVDEANAAVRSGQYGKALRSAEEVLRSEAGNSQALTAAAIAACNLKDAGKAKKYIDKLSGQRATMARQVCLRNNVSID